MANQLYDVARNRFAKAGINWEALNFYGLLVRADYSFNASHTVLGDIPQADRNYGADQGGGVNQYRDGNLMSNLVVDTNGACDADDLTFVTIPSGQDDIRAIIIYADDTAATSTLPLIAYLDTATGLPIAPNGGDIIVTWDNGENKIFRL